MASPTSTISTSSSTSTTFGIESSPTLKSTLSPVTSVGSTTSNSLDGSPIPNLDGTAHSLLLKPKSSSNHKVHVLGINQYKQAAACLAEAFLSDEVARYFFDTKDMAHLSEDQKWKLHVEILEYITAAHCYKGLVTAVKGREEQGEEGWDAVALWMPPGKNMDDTLTILRSGMWRLWYKLSKEGKRRFFGEFMPLLHDTKCDVLGKQRDGDSYYLVYIGSRKRARGRGCAKQLILDMQKQADTENRAIYLESSAGANVQYYEHLGFEFKRKIYLSRGEKPVALDIMVREPRTLDEGSDKGKIVKALAAVGSGIVNGLASGFRAGGETPMNGPVVLQTGKAAEGHETGVVVSVESVL